MFINQQVNFRPAKEQDYDFLYNMHIATMKEYIDKTWGWEDFAQQEFFKKSFEPEKIQIITLDTKDIGMVLIEEGQEDILLRVIEILPNYQRQGIGTYIVQKLINKASQNNKAVFLYVLKVNPAQNLYERLGFKRIAETSTHYVMKACLNMF
jgi:ribosomal protein S18 acetylase RimI-like enzyme